MTDEEILNRTSIIEIYCEILLGFLRYTRVRNYRDEEHYKEIYNRNLKFKYKDDYLRFRGCIDLMEDTQVAINHVYEKGLSIKANDYGERYLKLYGVLNAIYMQMLALIELVELFKIPPKAKMIKEFKQLQIIELRNKVAAHTPNYLNQGEKERETDFYRLTRTSIGQWGNKIAIVSSFDELEEFDLIPLMKEFSNKVEDNLESICERGLKSLFPNNSESKDWMVDRLNFARNKKL
jgi:hypothetical protein